MNFNIFYLSQCIQNKISTCNQYTEWLVFYTYNVSHFRLATFQVLSKHMWLMGTVLGSTSI